MPLNLYQDHHSEESVKKISTILAIAAGKGGVGKSSVTVNLALALSQMGFTVGIMDTDIYGPSVRKMLPEERLPQQHGAQIIPAWCSGIRMISMAFFRKKEEASVVRAPIANGIITQFIKQVDWGKLDYLLIDFPPGTGDIQLTLSQHANLTAAIMVTTPQEVAILDVRKAMHMFDQVKVPILGIVENMSFYYHEKTQEFIYLFGQGGGERLARETGVPFLGEIPINPEICRSGDSGHSLFKSSDPKNSGVIAFLNLATTVVEHVNALKATSKNSISNFELVWQKMDE
jgi:ATP-binding protein involved in chromosome partitioning